MNILKRIIFIVGIFPMFIISLCAMAIYVGLIIIAALCSGLEWILRGKSSIMIWLEANCITPDKLSDIMMNKFQDVFLKNNN